MKTRDKTKNLKVIINFIYFMKKTGLKQKD